MLQIHSFMAILQPHSTNVSDLGEITGGKMGEFISGSSVDITMDKVGVESSVKAGETGPEHWEERS